MKFYCRMSARGSLQECDRQCHDCWDVEFRQMRMLDRMEDKAKWVEYPDKSVARTVMRSKVAGDFYAKNEKHGTELIAVFRDDGLSLIVESYWPPESRHRSQGIVMDLTKQQALELLAWLMTQK